MKIGFIGAGKVSQAISLYFKLEHDITGIYSRSFNKSSIFSRKLDCPIFESPAALITTSDLIFIATRDDQITGVVDEISKNSENLNGKAFAHFSGSLSSLILSPLAQKGAFVFSLHPLQSFSNPETAIKNLSKTVFTVEGMNGFEPVLDQLFKHYNNQIFHISESDKTRYHIAAVILSNYLVTLYGISEELLKDIGMSEEEGKKLLIPLLQSTVSNIEINGFGALTGPLQRGDKNTILKHLEDLSNKKNILKIYQDLASETLSLMKKWDRENNKINSEVLDILEKNE